MKTASKIGAAAASLALSSLMFLCAQTNPAVPTPKFAYGGDAAELAAQFTDHLVFLPARINVSEPSLFILDTIQAGSSVAPERAAEIDRTKTPFPVLNLDSLDVPMAGLPPKSDSNFGARFGLEYQGTLGRDFLTNVVLEIDYARQTVRAYAPGSYKPPTGATVFPLTEIDGIPVVPLRVALERGKERNLDFFVETALDAPVVFDNRFLAAHHMNGERGRTIAAIDPFSAEPTAALGRLRALNLARNSLNDALAIYSGQTFPSSETSVAGAIGSWVLQRFTLTFDFPHRRLIFQPNSHFGEPDEEDKSGILFAAKGSNFKTFEIVQVQPNSPAALAGLKKGDVIEGVDTDPAADLSLLVVRDLFRQVGHKYRLTLQRGSQTQEITLQMRRYF